MCRMFLGFVFLSLIGCTQLTQAPPNKPVTSWQSTDQPPVFPGCEQEPTNDKQWLCFQENISKLFSDIFENHTDINPNLLKDTLWVQLRINHSGTIILDVINETDTTSALFLSLQKAVTQFPKMSPPTKTNLGVTTQVRVRLPIRVP